MATPTPVFPAAVATDAQLKVANNLIQTSLKVAIGSADTVLFVNSTAGFVPNCLVSIDQEILAIQSVTGAPNPTLTVAGGGRGFDGTAAATHAGGSKVSMLIDAWHHNVVATELKAIQQFLGANGSNLASLGPSYMTNRYDFAPQTPGGSLISGSNVITLAPVPLGVNGSDSNHYLYIDQGTGTAEAVLITGGTAVAGAASGTVIVTCANTHTGAWRIRSASTGIQEAAITAGPGALVQAPPGALLGVYAPVTFLDGQYFVAWGSTIERRFSTAGNVLNFIYSAPYGGLMGGRYSVAGGVTEPTDSFKIYARGSAYFRLANAQFFGGWGNIFFDNIMRGAIAGVGADTYAGDCVRLGSAANGGAGVIITDLTASDGTGTGTAIHAVYGLMELCNFNLQGGAGSPNSSRGIYFDPPAGLHFDETQIACGVIDSCGAGGIVVNTAATRFLGVSIDQVYMAGISGIVADLPAVTQNFSFTNSIFYGRTGGSGALVFRGGTPAPSSIALNNLRFTNQALNVGGAISHGIGFLGGANNVLITDCVTGINADGSANANTGDGISFYTGTYTDVVVRGGNLKGTFTPTIMIQTPTAGITIRNAGAYNPVGPAVITVGASPFTYTAGNSDETVYITGGTVSSITRAGVTLATASNISVLVPANQSVVVTYSAAPTMRKDVQ